MLPAQLRPIRPSCHPRAKTAPKQIGKMREVSRERDILTCPEPRYAIAPAA